MTHFDRHCKALTLHNRAEFRLGENFRGSSPEEYTQLYRVSPIAYRHALKKLEKSNPQTAEKINAIVLGSVRHV